MPSTQSKAHEVNGSSAVVPMTKGYVLADLAPRTLSTSRIHPYNLHCVPERLIQCRS
jgi:hypothetical protein